MKLCRYTLFLCLALVVSFVVLPSFSYADTPPATPAVDSNNPFRDGAFTPQKVDGAGQLNSAITNLENDLAAARTKASASKEALTAAGIGNLASEIEKSTRGEENTLDKEYEKLSPEAKSAMKNYVDDYSKISSIEKQMKNVRDAQKNGGKDLYFITYGEGDNAGVMYFLKDSDGNFTSMGGTSEGCTPLPVKLAESKQCIFCPLFTVLFNAANDMSTKSFAGLAGPISGALVIGFGLYIAFRVMLLVSGFTKQDGPKFITELLIQTFKVLIAIVLLASSNHIYNYVISPLLQSGLEFGAAFLFENGEKAFNQCREVYDGKSSIGDREIVKGVLPEGLYLKLHCFVYSVQMELAFPQAVGTSLMCISTNSAKGDLWIVKNVIPDFGMMIQGFVIWGFSLLVSLAFAFYLIDATVRIGIIGALMPFFIATWPFKLTAKYSSTGFTMLMNSFFVYTFVGIVVSINIQLMGNALGGPGGFDSIQDLINGDDVKELQKLLDIGLGGFLILIGCCIFGFKLTSQSSALADNLAGGGGGEGIGSKIGGLAASAVKGGAKAAGGAAAKGGKAAAQATGVSEKLGNARDKAAGAVGKAIGMGRYSGAAGGKGGGSKGGGSSGGGSSGGGSSGGGSSGGGSGGGTNSEQGGGNKNPAPAPATPQAPQTPPKTNPENGE